MLSGRRALEAEALVWEQRGSASDGQRSFPAGRPATVDAGDRVGACIGGSRRYWGPEVGGGSRFPGLK